MPLAGIFPFKAEQARWGSNAIGTISELLQQELPGLRGFSETSIKRMRIFYEAWNCIESNSSVATDELTEPHTPDNTSAEIEGKDTITIRQLQQTNYPNFPLAEFLRIGFTHHVTILNCTKDLAERLFYIRYCDAYKPTSDELENIIKRQDLYHHQGQMPNNFLTAMPNYKQAYRTIRMFKDEYLLDYINVEELGMHDEEIDERVIESNIVHNVKNFIMTFGRGKSFNSYLKKSVKRKKDTGQQTKYDYEQENDKGSSVYGNRKRTTSGRWSLNPR